MKKTSNKELLAVYDKIWQNGPVVKHECSFYILQNESPEHTAPKKDMGEGFLQ
jgi:hypothetical protein